MKIGIIVGEVSGDALGASLIAALKTLGPNIEVEGIVGPKLIQTGAKMIFPMEDINVMGLFEPLKRLPQLLKIRSKILEHFINHPPDVFIGIDAPDFNLRIERKLRQCGIKTVHYVSPTIWAWRPGRIKLIKQAVDLMLTIFPFESKIYEAANIPAEFVGHPFADEIPLEIDEMQAKETLGFKREDLIMAILPGSRDKELAYHTKIYLETADRCWRQDPRLKFVIPLISEQHKALVLACQHQFFPKLPVTYTVNNVRTAMSACNVALVTSGSATLEMMLHKKPMTVAYRMNPITYYIAKRMVKIPYIAMANLLAEEKLAPEFIQEKVRSEKMAAVLLDLLTPNVKREKIINRYHELHLTMRKNSSNTAAKAILALIERSR